MLVHHDRVIVGIEGSTNEGQNVQECCGSVDASDDVSTAGETTRTATTSDEESVGEPTPSSSPSATPSRAESTPSSKCAPRLDCFGKPQREIGMFGPTYAIALDEEKSGSFWEVAARAKAKSAAMAVNDETSSGQEGLDRTSFVCPKADSVCPHSGDRFHSHEIELCPDQFEWLQKMMLQFKYDSVSSVLRELIHYCNTTETAVRKKWIFKTPRCRRCSQAATGGAKVTTRFGVCALHWQWLTGVQERCAHASVGKTFRILLDAYMLYKATDVNEIWGNAKEPAWLPGTPLVRAAAP